MGWIVKSEDRIIWSPGKDSGRLFLGEVKLLEVTIGHPSGVDSPEPDVIAIDPRRFAAFIQETFNFLAKTNSGPIFAMVSGCLKVCIALQREIEPGYVEIPDRLRPFLVGVDAVLGAVRFESGHLAQSSPPPGQLARQRSEQGTAPRI